MDILNVIDYFKQRKEQKRLDQSLQNPGFLSWLQSGGAGMPPANVDARIMRDPRVAQMLQTFSGAEAQRAGTELTREQMYNLQQMLPFTQSASKSATEAQALANEINRYGHNRTKEIHAFDVAQGFPVGSRDTQAANTAQRHNAANAGLAETQAKGAEFAHALNTQIEEFLSKLGLSAGARAAEDYLQKGEKHQEELNQIKASTGFTRAATSANQLSSAVGLMQSLGTKLAGKPFYEALPVAMLPKALEGMLSPAQMDWLQKLSLQDAASKDPTAAAQRALGATPKPNAPSASPAQPTEQTQSPGFLLKFHPTQPTWNPFIRSQKPAPELPQTPAQPGVSSAPTSNSPDEFLRYIFDLLAQLSQQKERA